MNNNNNKLTKIGIFEHTDQEIEDALKFVIKDNPDKEWTDDELYSAVEKHLDEYAVDSSIEELLKQGLIKEDPKGHYSLSEKGEIYYDIIEKQKEKEKK